MNRKLVLSLAVVAMTGVGAAAAMRFSHSRRARVAREALTAFAPRWARVEGCLFGEGPVSADRDVMSRRFRRLAVGHGTDAWPSRCVDGLARDAPASVQADLTMLPRVWRPVDAVVATFRAEGGALAVDAALAAHEDLRAQVLAALHTAGVRPVNPIARAAPRALEPMTGDVLPIPLDASATLAATHLADGTFTAMWIDRTRARVVCRSRDRGASIRCRRYAAGDAGRTVVTLVGHDRAEALALVDVAGPPPSAYVASLDALDAPLFPYTDRPVASLAARVLGDTLLAAVQAPDGVAIDRVTRGGTQRTRDPAALPDRREAIIVQAGAPPRAWWIANGLDPAGHDAVVARALPSSPDEPLPPLVSVTSTDGPMVLLTGCQSGAVAWVSAVGSTQAALIRVDQDGPRAVAAPSVPDLPSTLACSLDGATLLGTTSVQHCESSGRCTAPEHREGMHRIVAIGADRVEVTRTDDGALRVRRGDIDALSQARFEPVADDAAHGGLTAQEAWLFAIDERLLLVIAGDTAASLWSADRGDTWHPTREADELPPRRLDLPMR